MVKEKSTDSPVYDSNKFSDEIKYLREENNNKICIIQTLLENQKNIQKTPDSRTLDINRNKVKSTHSFILPKKSLSNIKPPSPCLVKTSNSFDLLSENIENSLDASNVNVIAIEDNNAGSYSNKINTVSNTSISTEKKVNFRHNKKKQECKKRPDSYSYSV